VPEHAIDGGGHMDCLTYAVANGCEINELTCSAAAEGGYLDCLRFLHENNCDWDDRTIFAALSNGHHGCLQYAFENGCPLPVGAPEIERFKVSGMTEVTTAIRFDEDGP
jgi:hypothetical protein